MAAGGPSPFSLMKKDQKIKSAERLLCRTGLALQIRQNLGCNSCPKALIATLLQILLCPAAALPRIVLPDFARSFSADGVTLHLARCHGEHVEP